MFPSMDSSDSHVSGWHAVSRVCCNAQVEHPQHLTTTVAVAIFHVPLLNQMLCCTLTIPTAQLLLWNHHHHHHHHQYF